MFDLIIIGLGPAGITSAIYAQRYGLNFLLIGKEFGGLAIKAEKIENYPGFSLISGKRLMEKFKKNLKHLKINYKLEEVKRIVKGKDYFKVITEKNEYKTKKIILALGKKQEELIKGEKEFLGRGLSYCPSCDAPFFKDKIVAISGSGNEFDQAVEQLKKMAKKLLILKGKIKEIKGKEKLEKVVLENGKELKIDGLFLIKKEGTKEKLIKDLGIKTDELGYVFVNSKQETNIEGIYACGDLTCAGNKLKQIITACAEGAVAAKSVYEDLLKGR